MVNLPSKYQAALAFLIGPLSVGCDSSSSGASNPRAATTAGTVGVTQDATAGSSGSLGGTISRIGVAGSTACDTGSERCACYGNSTCDQGLVCLSQICVNPGVGGAPGAAGAVNATAGGLNSGGLSGAAGGVTLGGSPAMGGGSGSGNAAGSGAAVTRGGANGASGTPNNGGAAGGKSTGGSANGGKSTGGSANGGNAFGGTGAATSVPAGGVNATGGSTSNLPATCEARPAGNMIYDGTLVGSACSSAINSPRVGFWYSYNDGTGTQTPAGGADLNGVLGGRGGSGDCVIHSSGSGFSDWGGAIGFTFSEAKSGKCLYDAKDYSGIILYLKGTASGTIGSGLHASANTVRVSLSTPSTLASNEGGDCIPTSSKGCDDHFGVWCKLTADAFSPCTLSFTNLAQAGWGVAGTFNQTELQDLAITIGRDDGSSSVSWEIWVDDVQFF